MKIYDNITSFFRGRRRVYRGAWFGAFGGWNASIGALPFADVIFTNAVELLTDLTSDVSWRFARNNTSISVAFDRFYKQYAKIVFYNYYRYGVVVIGHTQTGEGPGAVHEFHMCTKQEYNEQTTNGFTTYVSKVDGLDVYPMVSPIYQMVGASDYDYLHPFREYLDNALNASNTVCKRLGAFVVGTPKNPTNGPTSIELDEDEKEALEKEVREGYGALDNQSQLLIMSREMGFQVISLASLDLKTSDRVKSAILAITDRIKVPANQVGIIDANSSKSLSNGSELREGDFNKYQSFERLLDATFVQLARDCRLEPGATDIIEGESVASYYVIYNKPKPAGTAQTTTTV